MLTKDDLDGLVAEAQKCFRTSFGGIITIFIREEARVGKRDNPIVCGKIIVDGQQSPPLITTSPVADDDKDASPTATGEQHCTWRASKQILSRIFDGDRQLTGAFVSGRLVIAGDMAVMSRLVLTGRHEGLSQP